MAVQLCEVVTAGMMSGLGLQPRRPPRQMPCMSGIHWSWQLACLQVIWGLLSDLLIFHQRPSGLRSEPVWGNVVLGVPGP